MAVIVTAEDDIDVADMLTTTLSRAGHQVHPVGTGPRALQMVAQFHPDLVILDHAMPGMTGLDVARRLRADSLTASTPLLMFSAAAPDGALDVFCRDHRAVMDVAEESDAQSVERRRQSRHRQ